MQKVILIAFFLLCSNLVLGSNKKYITVDADSLSRLSEKSLGVNVIEQKSGIALLEVNEENLGRISELMHEDFKRCGGFIFFENINEARADLYLDAKKSFASKSLFADYSITENKIVTDYISEVSDVSIEAMIRKLSSYKNRYYKSKTGVESSRWIGSVWAKLVEGRNDAKVEFVEHDSWPQPSVILTIEGSSSEVIVIGGHADSIAGFFGGANARAPGADDNASGISTITEVIRVITKKGYKPTKTFKFMAYAAEEVGLKGSKEIADSMNAAGVDVIGAIQLDMTNFKGSDLDIVMMSDYTNKAQNAFLGKIIDTYLPKISWGYDKCGYACSDHASWHRAGYPASMPFEARTKKMNRNIHTKRDLIKVSGDSAVHAQKFAKLALAYLIELDR